jgi:hypothetical protein
MKFPQLLSRIVQKRLFFTRTMAKSRYEYVKDYESEDKILKNCWIVVRYFP